MEINKAGTQFYQNLPITYLRAEDSMTISKPQIIDIGLYSVQLFEDVTGVRVFGTTV